MTKLRLLALAATAAALVAAAPAHALLIPNGAQQNGNQQNGNQQNGHQQNGNQQNGNQQNGNQQNSLMAPATAVSNLNGVTVESVEFPAELAR